MPNLKNPNELDIAPANMVGGMRVKQPDQRRASLRNEEEEKMAMKDSNQDDGLDETNEMSSEQERLRIRALQERQAQDMHAHTASRQPDITKNAGNNVQQTFNAGFQPRSMNH